MLSAELTSTPYLKFAKTEFMPSSLFWPYLRWPIGTKFTSTPARAIIVLKLKCGRRKKKSSYWLMAFGYWLLAFGFWLLANGFLRPPKLRSSEGGSLLLRSKICQALNDKSIFQTRLKPGAFRRQGFLGIRNGNKFLRRYSR